MYDNYGFEEGEADAHLDVLTRAFSSEWACRLEVADCVQQASAHFAALMGGSNQ